MKKVSIFWSSGKTRVDEVEDSDAFIVSMFGSSRIPKGVTVVVEPADSPTPAGVPDLKLNENPSDHKPEE